MRGCVDDLAEEGLKYCLTNEKFCEICKKTACNDKASPNTAIKHELNLFLLLTLLNAMTLGALKKYF